MLARQVAAIFPAAVLNMISAGKIAEIYAEADARIIKELGCDAVMAASEGGFEGLRSAGAVRR